MHFAPRAVVAFSLVTALAASSCGSRTPLFLGTSPSSGSSTSAGSGGGGAAGASSASSSSSGEPPPACSPGSTQSCYDGPPGTENVGVCHAGTATCTGNGWGPCAGEVTPQPPNCDGIDHTCTGRVVTCPAGTTCGASISGLTSVPSPSWSFNGTATPAPAAGLLTTNDADEAGTIVYEHAILTDAFTLTFEIMLGNGDGGAFMLETTGPNAVGQDGGGLGVAGIVGYAIELDTYDNAECGDPDADHVGLDVLGPICGQGVQMSFWTSSLMPFALNLHDGQWHAATVAFVNGNVTLGIDGQTVIPGIPLPGWAGGISYWYGFSGATGQASAVQEVRNVEVTFPTPRCL